MEAQDLIQKLEARGITLTLCGENLSTAPEAIPAGIMTTIQAHKPALIRYLQAQPAATPQSEPSGKPVKTLENLRHLLASGQLDDRALVVLGYPHRDTGRVIREQFGHLNNAQAEGLNPGYFENRLREIQRALESDMAA